MAATRPLQSRADCEANFELIRSWISQCELHPVCTRVPDFASKFQLPTRLIDINPGPEALGPRLVLSSDLDGALDCRYVALSHCWGDPSKVPKTMRTTLAAHQERIAGFSKTFEDAIEVTRQIGVRYLWIDSLCIVQQDVTDWEIECSKMSLIYARAYCVLSALDAEDGSVGLFIPRSSHSPPPQIDYLTSWNSTLDGCLSTRGWAFQEHQLSTRIVHFTKFRLLWECRGCVAYEDSPIPLHRALAGRDSMEHSIPFGLWRFFDGKPEKYMKKIEGFFETSILTPGPVPERHDMHTRWLRAIEVYSSRSLTFSDDRLPAISGLAAAMSSILGGKVYLAGIWKDDIVRGLLWQRVESTTITNSKKVASIPSWSWAAYSGRVQFLGAIIGLKDCMELIIPVGENLAPSYKDIRFRGNVEMKVVLAMLAKLEEEGTKTARIKCWTTLSSLDPFGQINGGTLQIVAEARRFRIGISSPRSKWRVLDEECDQVIISLDYPGITGIVEVTFALLVGDEYGQGGCYGLILHKVDADSFRRAGIFYLQGFRGNLKFEETTVTIV